MADSFLSEIAIFSFEQVPKGWAQCNGQLLPINQNQALFALLGTQYGGNGQTNFALPDLRGRVPMHVGAGHTQGERSGEVAHTVSLSELPGHTHAVSAVAAPGTVPSPIGNVWAQTGAPGYASAPDTSMRTDLISSVGGSQAHNNMSPFLALNFCIALVGVFPSQS